MKTVLVVDDAMFMRKALKLILEKSGYKVIGEAENGIKAIMQYKKLAPDIVTMDIHMPEMGGIDAISEIMKEDSSANIIIISAAGEKMRIIDALNAGAKNFIVKPFSEEKVLQVMDTF